MEIGSSLSSVKSAIALLLRLKSVRETQELSQRVINSQESAMRFGEENAVLARKITELEAKIVASERWEIEKERYELKTLDQGVYAYMLKPEFRGPSPPHLVCTNCFLSGRISYLQWGTERLVADRRGYVCPSCKTEIFPVCDKIDWLD